MFILAHLVAALASILPLLVAIQKGRNGDFDFVYQRTIDYTSSIHLPNIFDYFLQNQDAKSTSSSALFVADPINVTITDQDTSHPISFYVGTEHLGPNTSTNATEEANSTLPFEPSFLFRKYRQVISNLRVGWYQLEIFRHVLLIFHGMVCLMDDLTDFSTAVHLHHYDFTLASPSRTRKALGNALVSVWRSFGIETLTSSFVLAMLIKLSVAIAYTLSIGLGYYIYVLLHDIAKTQENLGRVGSTAKALGTHRNIQQMDLDWQAEMFEVLRLEKEEIKTTSSKQQKDSRNQIIALRTAAASQQVRIGRAHAEIQQLCDELTTAQSGAETQQKRADDWKQQVEIAKTHQVAASRTIEGLQMEVESQQQHVNQKALELERLGSKHGALQQESRKASLSAQSLQQRVERLENDLSTKTSAVEALEKQLEHQKQDLDHRAIGMTNLDSENSALRQETTKANLSAQSLQQRVERLENDLSTKTSAVEALEKQLEHQKQDLDHRAIGMTNLDSENSALRQEITKANLSAQNFQQRVQRLEYDLSTKTLAVEALNKQLEHQQQHLDHKNVEMASLQSENKALQGHQEELQKELSDTNDTHDSELQRLMAEHGINLDFHVAKVLAAEERIVQLEEQLELQEELHDSVKHLQGHQEEFQDKLSDTNDNDDSKPDSHVAEVLTGNECTEQLEEDLAAEGSGRRKRNRGGKNRAEKRVRIERRHSLSMRPCNTCPACGGPQPVKWTWKSNKFPSSQEPERCGRVRRYSCGTPACKTCSVCGGLQRVVEASFPGINSASDNPDIYGSPIAVVGGPESVEASETNDLVGSSQSELESKQDKVGQDSGPREATGLSSSKPKPTRRRQRHKGQKQVQNQEQPQDLGQQPYSNSPQSNGQVHGPSTLPSRWGPNGSFSPSYNNPPHPPFQPSNHFARYPPRPLFQPSAQPTQNPPHRPFQALNQPTQYSPPHFPRAQNAGPGYQPMHPLRPFNPNNAVSFPPRSQTARNGSPGYNAGQPSRQFNPSAIDFRPLPHAQYPFPNTHSGPVRNQGPTGPPYNNISRWAY